MNYIKDILYDPIKNTFVLEDNDNLYYYCNINQANKIKGKGNQVDKINNKLSQKNLITSFTHNFSNKNRRLLLIEGKGKLLKALDIFNETPNAFKSIKHQIHLLPLIESSFIYYASNDINRSIKDTLNYLNEFLLYHTNNDTIIKIEKNKIIKPQFKKQSTMNANTIDLYITKTKDNDSLTKVHHSLMYICPLIKQYQNEVAYIRKQRYENNKRIGQQFIFLPPIKQFSSRNSLLVNNEDNDEDDNRDSYKNNHINSSRFLIKHCMLEREMLKGFNMVYPKQKMRPRLDKGFMRNRTNKQIYDYEEMIFKKANPITYRNIQNKELYYEKIVRKQRELLIKKLKKHQDNTIS